MFLIKNLQKEKGITLIALVVTIIVLLLLAGISISMLTGQNGILKQANKAKTENDKMEELEKLKLAVSAAQIDGLGTITTENLKVEIKDILNVKDDSIHGSGPWTFYTGSKIYVISLEGKISEGWGNVYDDDKNIIGVTKGNLTLKIGTIINYDATSININKDVNELVLNNSSYTVAKNEGKNEILYTSTMGFWQEGTKSLPNDIVTGNGYGSQRFDNSTNNNNQEVQWKLLGADEQTGELLIISSKTLYSCRSTPEVFYLRGYTGTANGIEELDNISKVYGYGYGTSATTPARSVTVEDINKLTGYVPKYESTYVIDWEGTNLKYTLNGDKTGLLDTSKRAGFNYFVINYNNKIESWHSSTSTNGVVMPNGMDADALTETHYYYNVKDYYKKDMDNPEICDLIIDADSSGYWLASCHTRFYDTYFGFGLRLIDNNGGCWGAPLYHSNGWRW